MKLNNEFNKDKIFNETYNEFEKGDSVFVVIYDDPLFPTIRKFKIIAHHRTQMTYKFKRGIGYLKFGNGKFFDKHKRTYTTQYVLDDECSAGIIKTPNREIELLFKKQRLMRKILKQTKSMSTLDRNTFVQILYDEFHRGDSCPILESSSELGLNMCVYLHSLGLNEVKALSELLDLEGADKLPSAMKQVPISESTYPTIGTEFCPSA